MRALVTGSAGFIGRHFVRHLVTTGWDVDRVDIAATQPVDCRNYFRRTIRHFDLVVHAAAVIGGRVGIDENPAMLAASDLSIDAALWDWALRTKPGRILYFSSSAAYPVSLQNPYPGLRARRPLTETDIAVDTWMGAPDMTYGWVKLVGEVIAQHVRAEGVPVTIARPFSGYGTDQSLDYPFPSFLARALAREDPFDIWGDGTQVRDFIHVDDVVRACMVAVNAEHDGPLNIGTGVGTSFAELADMVCVAAGYDPQPRFHPDKPTGVAYRVADPTLLHRLYEPEVTLQEGIDRALKGVS